MQKFVFINQKLVQERKANISINDRAFLFGDGVFETCRIISGKVDNFSAHKARLGKSLAKIKIFADISDLEKKAQQLITKNKVDNGILKIVVSRGEGSYGYLPTNQSKPLIFIQTLPLRQLPKKITLGISSNKTPEKSLGKTLNSLPYILTKIEAQEKNLFDCVMLSTKKFVGETSSANIFWIKNGKVFTAKKSCGIVAGTVRDKLIKTSLIKISEVEARISRLKNADEIFLTNAIFLIIPVDEFLGKKLQKKFAPQFLKMLLSSNKKALK